MGQGRESQAGDRSFVQLGAGGVEGGEYMPEVCTFKVLLREAFTPA